MIDYELGEQVGGMGDLAMLLYDAFILLPDIAKLLFDVVKLLSDSLKQLRIINYELHLSQKSES